MMYIHFIRKFRFEYLILQKIALKDVKSVAYICIAYL